MIYQTQKGQVSSGEAIGVLLLDSPVPFIPGDVANATTYNFPVRFERVEDFSVHRAIGKDPTVYDNLLHAARSLLVIGGLQNQRNFHEFAIEESGFLDADAVEAEVVGVAKRLVAEEPNIRAILLECSLLPPYGAAVQEAVI
jgi:hypothetical protein